MNIGRQTPIFHSAFLVTSNMSKTCTRYLTHLKNNLHLWLEMKREQRLCQKYQLLDSKVISPDLKTRVIFNM